MRLTTKFVGLGLAAALALSACSGSPETKPTTEPTDGGTSSEETPGDVTQGTVALTVGKPDGAIATESNNPWIGDSSALKLGYVNTVFEPLGIMNLIDGSQAATPWLASEIEWAPDFTSLAVTAREGVKWNDGTDFTADDIAFTFNLLKDTPAIETAALGIKEVVQDGTKVTISFESSVFAKQDKVLHKFIVPKHIWEKVTDVTTETNPNPVGTGPYTLENFTSQSVTMTARDDYWGGELAVPTIYYVSYNDNTSLTTALANGDADWAQIFIPNVEEAFVQKDPEHNVYWAPAGLGVDTMFVNTTKKPFNDKAFRQAINLVIDRKQYQEVAREGGVPVLSSITGLPTPAGDPWIGDDFKGKEFTVDVDAAKKILTDAKYTWEGDKLIDPDGEAVSFTLSVPQGWSDYVTGISLIQQSVKTLGIDAKTDTPDADSWWAAKSTGDFDAILHWTDTGLTPYDLYADMMSAEFFKPIGEDANFNFGRFQDPAVDAALKDFTTAADDAARHAALGVVQNAFVDAVPTMPVGTRPFIGQYNTRAYEGWPSEADPYTIPDPTQPSSVLILTKLRAVK